MEPCYRSGSLVWGGGTVLLPMLLREAVPPLTSSDAFVQGVSLSHALPGPGVFSLASFVGGAYAGPIGALLASLSVHLPGALLMCAALPFWAALRRSARVSVALRGLNAGCAGMVIGSCLLLFECVPTPPQHAVVILCFAALHSGWPAMRLRLPVRSHPALTVGIGALLGVALCLPWQLMLPTDHPSTPAAVRVHSSSLVGSGAAAPHATFAATPAVTAETSPPPPTPSPPDPSPPPPPTPFPPDADRRVRRF